MSGITTQLEHTRAFRRASHESMKRAFIKGPSLFTKEIRLEEIYADLLEAREMHGVLIACDIAFDSYNQTYSQALEGMKNKRNAQDYLDLMALFVFSNVGDALYERETQLTYDEVADLRLMFQTFRQNYCHCDQHHDQAMRLEIFELAVRYNHLLQRQYKGVFAPEIKVA
jgi:hypothetical protein